MSAFEVIVTLGPSILNHEGRLAEINDLGPCIFRINGAHSDAEQTRSIVAQCRSMVPDCRLMIDLPGNKVRTGWLDRPIPLVKGERFTLRPGQLNWPDWSHWIEGGQIVLAHDARYRLEIEDVVDGAVVLMSHSDGTLTSNRGLHIAGISEDMPFLFEKDLRLIDAACRERVDFLSLSFVRNAGDIKEAREHLRHPSARTGALPTLIAKIETAASLASLDSILTNVDAVNVDRGDLAADIGILDVPAAQGRVIERARDAHRPVYLATQFLSSMVESPVPLIAEVSDIFSAIESGVSRIQLSEETAVGRYPVECVAFVFHMVKTYFS